MNGKSHDDQCCPPSRAQYTCRASRPAIAAQAPACPALPRPHIRARQVPITQFGIQQMTARHALALWTGKAGDAAAARDQYAELLPVSERVLGPKHPHVLADRSHLTYWTKKAGDSSRG